jgi:germination protein YpeB
VAEAVSSRTPVRTVLTAEAALAAAEKFLAARRYGGLRESYHMVKENILTATYCAAEGDTICYPDMVKVDVAMDNGEILRFDARAYLTAHTRRSLPEAVLTEEDAAAKVPEGLTLEAQHLALIPARGTEEVFCRELVCRTEEGERYLLYFNAVTGAQEKILVLLEDETGTLAL